jgi:hypothetical protein
MAAGSDSGLDSLEMGSAILRATDASSGQSNVFRVLARNLRPLWFGIERDDPESTHAKQRGGGRSLGPGGLE